MNGQAVLACGIVRWLVSGLLFDKDGTLLDFTYLWGQWSLQLMEELKPYAAQADWAQALGVTVDGDEVRYDPAGPLAMASNDQLESILAWHLYQSGIPWSEGVEAVRQVISRVNTRLEQTRPVRAMPGLLAFLEACSRASLPLAVVTSDDTSMAERHLEWLGIRRYFQAVIGRDAVPNGKPFPDLALYACRRLGIMPSETVLIGDTLADVGMARSAGCGGVIQITSVHSPASTGADGQIRHYGQLGFNHLNSGRDREA